jgi:hypothetical protein
MIGPWKRVVEAETRADILTGQLAQAHDVIRTLSQMIGDMKREGFALPPTTDQPVVQDIGLPNEVMAAIDARGHTRQGREKLMQYAQRQSRAGAEPGEVAQAILDGERFSWGA